MDGNVHAHFRTFVVCRKIEFSQLFQKLGFLPKIHGVHNFLERNFMACRRYAIVWEEMLYVEIM